LSRSARLLRLLQHLRAGPAPVTAARLAERTGVSERAIYRDIAALRASEALIATGRRAMATRWRRIRRCRRRC
jgi:predicted DNA-binding transcriptional regulator YafY